MKNLVLLTLLALASLAYGNSIDPQGYYKNFLYRSSGNCYGPYGLWHHFVGTLDEHFRLPDSQDGREMRANVRLFLMSNGSYIAFYSESVKMDPKLNPWATNDIFQILYNQEINGSYQYSPEIDGLKLEGLGHLTKSTLEGNPAVRLTVVRDIHQSGMNGQSATLTKLVGDSGPTKDMGCR